MGKIIFIRGRGRKQQRETQKEGKEGGREEGRRKGGREEGRRKGGREGGGMEGRGRGQVSKHHSVRNAGRDIIVVWPHHNYWLTNKGYVHVH